MGEVIYDVVFARPQPSKKKNPSTALIITSDFVRRNDKRLGLTLVPALSTTMVGSLWYTNSLLYGYLLFLGVSVALSATAVSLAVWAEDQSPDWDHQ